MIRRSVRVFSMCLVLGALVVQAFAQDAVKLEYKFTPGELQRYKMIMAMDMQISMGDSKAQMPPMTVQMVAVYRQRTKKVLPNGDAVLVTAFESIKMNMAGKSNDMPLDKIPLVTMTMSKNGQVKSIEGMEKMAGAMGGSPLMNMSSMGQSSAALPSVPVMIGDIWTQDIPFPLGGGNIKAQGTLLSTDTKLGKFNVATFKQDVGGDFDLSMPLPMGGDGSTASNITGNGSVQSGGTVFFSVEKGQLIRTAGTAKAQLTMNLPGAPQGQGPGQMGMNMTMNFEMFQISSGK